jgi:ribonuclease HII
MIRAPRPVVRAESGLWAFERVLQRCGFAHVAGTDEAGRGPCAGPLVVAAVVLPPGRRGEVPGLRDSKLLTERAREAAYAEVLDRALAVSVVVVSPQEIDRVGIHVQNLRAMRQAVHRLDPCPSYVLTDGFAVPGLPAPALAVWKGDRLAACVAAASVVAKVTRDRMMVALASDYPAYGFEVHKGYNVPEHQAALDAHGPCPEHRFSWVNVRRAAGGVRQTARMERAS